MHILIISRQKQKENSHISWLRSRDTGRGIKGVEVGLTAKEGARHFWQSRGKSDGGKNSTSFSAFECGWRIMWISHTIRKQTEVCNSRSSDRDFQIDLGETYSTWCRWGKEKCWGGHSLMYCSPCVVTGWSHTYCLALPKLGQREWSMFADIPSGASFKPSTWGRCSIRWFPHSYWFSY